MGRIGIPSSHVASQQLVPYEVEAFMALGTSWKMFEITSEAMMRSPESCGIQRGAILSYRNSAEIVTAGVFTS
jgi:hypothetical protein